MRVNEDFAEALRLLRASRDELAELIPNVEWPHGGYDPGVEMRARLARVDALLAKYKDARIKGAKKS